MIVLLTHELEFYNVRNVAVILKIYWFKNTSELLLKNSLGERSLLFFYVNYFSLKNLKLNSVGESFNYQR